MGFNSSGVYTPPAGATTAAPGDLIKSATWDAIFTDISAALTLLGQQLYGSTAVNHAASPYTQLATDTLLLVDSSGGTVTINLLAASAASGYPIRIKDSQGSANTNNITIARNGSDTIEGLTSLTINEAFGGYFLYPVTGGWIISP
jgi:hypothetical protein